ncbi:restriction endonuclease subunit S, partial [Vibrio genomosp. F10]|uniref:restriction endonuclease subunit S n=1 Tax=Vibrio genomosp. F10 TaxID=723171 RepID=UPI00084C3EFA
MSELPKGWVELPLEHVASWGSGGTPKRSEPSYYGGDVPWVKTGDLGPRYLKEASEYISQLGLEKSSAKLFPKGSVAIAMYGATIGKTSTLDFEASTNQACAVGNPIDGVILTDFLYYFLTSEKQNFIKKGKGGAQPNISQQLIKAHEIQLPSLAEQKRIVEKLDEVLAQVDTIKARLDCIPDLLKRFRQSVLASAVSGKLTEEWRGINESQCSLQEIDNIIESRSELVTKRMQVPQKHLKNEEYPIPDGWKWVSLDSLSSKIVDGVHHKPVYVDEGVPFMSVKDIKGGKIYFDNCKYVSPETHEEIHPRCNPEKGDLLITKSGTIGRTAIVRTDEVFDLFVSVALIKPASTKVNMEFINIALMHWVNSIDVSSRVVGTAIKNLHLRDMRVLAIPFAPLTEQKEIVRLVDQYFAFADTIEAQVKKAQARVDNLTQSILAKAFRGELVPQDPTDEPADKLLERIDRQSGS